MKGLIKIFVALSVLTILSLSFSKQSIAKERCSRIVYCYDIQVEVPDSDRRLYMASKGYINQLLMNSVASNYFFELKFQPTRILAEPWEKPSYLQADRPNEYQLWGRLWSIGDNRFKIELYLVSANTRELVAKGSTIIEGEDEAMMGGMFAALNLGSTEKGSRPLIDVITEYEKKGRVKNPDKHKPICAEIKPSEFSQGETIYLKPKEVKQIQIEVRDPDGEPIKGMVIPLKGYKGEILPKEIITDYKGIAHIAHVAPDEECEYRIESSVNYETPGEKRQSATLYPSIFIKVRKPVTELTGTIAISESTTEDWGSKEDLIARHISKTTASSSIKMTIIRSRIENTLNNMQLYNRIIEELGKYEIVTGHSEGALQYISDYTGYNKYEGKLRMDEKSSTIASGSGCSTNVTITALVNRSADGTILPALSRKWCLVVGIGSNSKMLFQGGEYATRGKSTGQRRNSDGEMESFSENLSPKTTIGTGFDYNYRTVSEEELVVPLEIADSDALERYLLNPTGTLSLSLKGSYKKIKGSPLYDTKVTVNLKLNPVKEN